MLIIHRVPLAWTFIFAALVEFLSSPAHSPFSVLLSSAVAPPPYDLALPVATMIHSPQTVALSK